jgi:hypothetical protein
MTAKELSEQGFTNYTKVEWLDLVSIDYYGHPFDDAINNQAKDLEKIVLDAMDYYATQCCRNI